MALSRILRKVWRGYSSLIASPAVGYPILVDYPVSPVDRYEYGKKPHKELAKWMAQFQDNLHVTLGQCRAVRDSLDRIGMSSAGAEPQWDNVWFSGLDAAALYAILVAYKPARFLEVGSGNSTRFARRAILDHALPTRIISIDPRPRVEVDTLCDEVLREPLENCGSDLIRSISPGDILFIDGSHRVFQNSDVTVFFLELLPRLPVGVLVHLHDIFLPYDYPSSWAHRYYSEQYMLAAWLLAGCGEAQLLFSSAYAGANEAFQGDIESLAGATYQRGLRRMREAAGGAPGVSFWMRLGH